MSSDPELHLITPASNYTPDSLIRNSAVPTGSCIADLRSFPPAILQVTGEQSFVDISEPMLSETDYWMLVRQWFIKFTQETGLQDELSVGGLGFWWTLNFLAFSPGLTDLGNAFIWIDLLVTLRELGWYAVVVVHGQHDTLYDLTKQVFGGVSVRVEVDRSVELHSMGSPTRKLGLLAARLMLSGAYLVFAAIHNPDIVFFADTNLLRVSTDRQRQKVRDVFLGGIAEALRNRRWRIGFVEKYGWNATWCGMLARGFFFPSDLIDMLSRPSLHKIGPFRKIVNRWRQRWIVVRPKLQSNLNYRGFDLSPLLLPLIARAFLDQGPSIEIMASLWRRILRLWRPKLLFINNSYRPTGVAVIQAARTLELPTMEQQHGVIGRNHGAYLVPASVSSVNKPPLCDTMIVWGEHTQRLLVNTGVYRADQVVVCGSPRIDRLFDELPERENTLLRLGIPTNAKVILYSSNMLVQDLVSDILENIQADEATGNVHWIIKLHPREKTRQNWQSAILARQLTNVTVVEGEVDFYALLAACDLHVSFASTTMIEAAVLGKPNLGLDVGSVFDPVGFRQAGAFLPVAPNRLGIVAAEILQDPGKRIELLREQKRFATDWCLHDGQALERIVAHIESVIVELEMSTSSGLSQHHSEFDQ